MSRFNKISAGICILVSWIILSGVSIASQDIKDKQAILEKASKIQIPFIVNEGQIEDRRVKYYTNTFGGTAFITDRGEIVYTFTKGIQKTERREHISKNETKKEESFKGIALREELIGSVVKEIKGQGVAETQVSYFRGNDRKKWRSGILTYNTINLGEVYEGIELKLKAYGKNIEKLFTVKPEGRPEEIRLKIDGAKGIKVNEIGELEVDTELGVVKFTKPAAYQDIEGKKKDVAVAYSIEESKIGGQQLVYSFKVGEYDRTKELIIDPLLASTFLGGSSSDVSKAISIDTSGNVYVTGYTNSSNFPTTVGAYDTSYNVNSDVFISKLDSNLSANTLRFEESSPSITYTGTWNNYTCASCSGGALKYSNKTGGKCISNI